MGPQSLGEHRSDAPDLLQRVERTERSARLAILDDPPREGGADAGQAIEILGGGDIHVDRTGHERGWWSSVGSHGAARRRRGDQRRLHGLPHGGRGRRSGRSSPRAAGRDGGVHPGELRRERLPGVCIRWAGS